MKFIKQIFVLFCVCFANVVYTYAQDITQDNANISENQTVDEDEYDTEAEIIDPATDEAFDAADEIQKIVDFIENALRDNTVTMSSFAIYNDNPAITEYDESNQMSAIQRFDVFSATTDKAVPFTFVKQTFYNSNNHAWDYIYERIYDAQGKLIHFVRRYSTYNSGCAEVAFERSEYYFNSTGETIKKTYEIFDSDNNKLDFDKCWMERESYDKYMTIGEFKSKYPLFE